MDGARKYALKNFNIKNQINKVMNLRKEYFQKNLELRPWTVMMSFGLECDIPAS